MPTKRPAPRGSPSERTTLGPYLGRWLARIRRTRSAATYAMYETVVRLHVLPVLGSRRLETISTADVEAWQDRLVDQGVSPMVRRRAQQIAAQALQPLVDAGTLGRNVFRLVEPPTAAKPSKEVLKDDQLRRLLAHCSDAQVTAMILLASTAMLRIGEIVALKVGDFDGKTGTVTTNQAVSRKPKRGAKNEERRALPLPTMTVKAIRAYLKSRLSPKPMQPLFSGANGKRLNRHNFRNRVWVPLLEHSKLPLTAHFDSLRYSGTGMLLKSGLSTSAVASRARLKDARMIKERHANLIDSSQPTTRDLNKAFREMAEPKAKRR